MLRRLMWAAAGALAPFGSVAAAPPDTGPPDTAPPSTAPPDPASASFERQLAELSFGTFLLVQLELNPDVFTCTEPASSRSQEVVTCFALIGGERIVIATTATSGATGRFEFDVVADYGIASPEAPPSTAPPAPNESVPTTYSVADRNEANIAVLLYGDELNDVAQTDIAEVLNAGDGNVIAVNRWAWDPTSAMFTVDYTLNPDSAIDPDDAAWQTASTLSEHWAADQPFRDPAATIRPTLRIVVNGIRYSSGWDLIIQVADGSVTQDVWLAAARQT